MNTYKALDGIRFKGKSYKAGDTFEATLEEMRGITHLIELVETTKEVEATDEAEVKKETKKKSTTKKEEGE